MEKLELNAKTRELKGDVNKLRLAGLVPAVLYGHKIKNENLTVLASDFDKIYKKAGESTIVNLVTEDGKKHSVLIHDIQLHHLTSKPAHIDFYEVSMTEKLKAKVALSYKGEPRAVKELGGILVKILNEVEVECLPADLPHDIEVDITGLAQINSALHVKDLALPKNVRVLNPNEEILVKIQAPRNVEAELATPVVEDVSKVEGAAETKPETVSEEKKPGNKKE